MSEHRHYRYWNEKDEDDVAQARDFGSLAKIALRIIGRHPPLVHMVSGPISTGGIGNGDIEINMRAFRAVIEHLCSRGLNVFSQIPFEGKFIELGNEWKETHPGGGYCMPILNDFYLRVFSSGRIAAVHFMHDWRSSFGATWEYETCGRLAIDRRELGQEECSAIVTAYKA